MAIASFAAAVLVLSVAAPNAGVESECFTDAARVCPALKPADSGFLDCLRAHRDDLSPACRHDMQQVDRLSDEFQESCRLFVLEWCHDAPPGTGRVLACLDRHATMLSPACAQFVAVAVEKSDAVGRACRAELREHCPGVAAGTGGRYLCLKSKARLLSSRCLEALGL